jgi:hypothetical protein
VTTVWGDAAGTMIDEGSVETFEMKYSRLVYAEVKKIRLSDRTLVVGGEIGVIYCSRQPISSCLIQAEPRLGGEVGSHLLAKSDVTQKNTVCRPGHSHNLETTKYSLLANFIKERAAQTSFEEVLQAC